MFLGIHERLIPGHLDLVDNKKQIIYVFNSQTYLPHTSL